MNFKEIKELFIEFDDGFGEKRLSECTDLDRYAEFFQNSVFSVIKKEGQRAGVVCFNLFDNGDGTQRANLNFIAVKKDFRNLGLEELMLEHAEVLAKKHSAREMKVMVSVGMVSERQFYEKFGYKYLNQANEGSIFLNKQLD